MTHHQDEGERAGYLSDNMLWMLSPTAVCRELTWLRDAPDSVILAEWDRKGWTPDYVPMLYGRRPEHLQGPLLDSLLHTLDEFIVCRSP
eukprot:15467035-Alexandrium_andersonii.AAC.1